MTDSTGELAKALAAFQAEMPTVAKTKTANTGSYSYKYADLADVTHAAMPLLAKHGLSFVTTPYVTERGMGLEGVLLHESGERLTGSLPFSGGQPQQIGSALTYLRRYLFGCMTGVVTDDDDDGQAAQSGGAKRKPAAKKAASAPEREPWPQAVAPSGPRLLDTSSALAKALYAKLRDQGIDKVGATQVYRDVTGRQDIASSKELTEAQAREVLKRLDAGGAA